MLAMKAIKLSTLLILTGRELQTHEHQRSSSNSAFQRSDCICLHDISLKLYSGFLTMISRNRVLPKWGNSVCQHTCTPASISHAHWKQPTNQHCLSALPCFCKITYSGELTLLYDHKNSTSRWTHRPSFLWLWESTFINTEGNKLKEEAKWRSQSK